MKREEILKLKRFDAESACNGWDAVGYKIGFASRYFTLWACSYKSATGKCTCSFMQNIMAGSADDVEKVKAAFPNLDVDLNLKGSAFFSFDMPKPQPKLDIQCWQSGRYKGQLIEDCKDADYLLSAPAYFNRFFLAGASRHIGNALIKLGYILMRGNEPVKIDENTDMMSGWWLNKPAADKMQQMLQEQQPFEFTAGFFGIDENDETACWTKVKNLPKELFLYFRGKRYDGNYYCSAYSLPLVNGKPKRVKGKTIKVTKYHRHADGWFADEFEVL